MKLVEIKIYISLVAGFMITIMGYGQVITKKQQREFSVKEGVVIELDSKYTNVEFELTDSDRIVVDAIMQVEGLSQKEVDAYFKKWNLKVEKKNNKVVISSLLIDHFNSKLQKHGYYKGYFLDKETLNVAKSEMQVAKENFTSSNTQQRRGNEIFNFEAYIEKGNVYLKQWERENKEPIGKRWYNKTKEERKKMWKARKATQPKRENKPAIIEKTAFKKKSKLPNANVRALSKRAIINKTLKIKIPRKARLRIKARHGKVVFSEEVINLHAELSYVLLQATKISGKETSIKGRHSNFEADQWNDGSLDVVFSGFTLIKEVKNMSLTSNASVVSIDKVTESIDAKGNFKMLSIDAFSSIKYVNLNVKDSKQVWVKLPKIAYNLHYEGFDSRLIHPEKFSAKTKGNKLLIESTPLRNNERFVKIKALSSVMQIYDIPWEDLKIKNL